MKISSDFPNLNAISALLFLQLPRILSIYNKKLPYKMHQKPTQNKQLA